MKKDRSVIIWLICGFFMVYIMVMVGGITRLTGSGLSIADWQPIMGALPPLNQTDWNDKFDLYKATPEYNIKNKDFTLDEFKSIFWWEFIHRNLGRLIGIVFIVPFLIFWLQKKFDKPMIKKMFVLLFLGAFQGVLGWYMVYSGLIDKPYVNHFRLAAHFITALSVMMYILWILLDMIYPKKYENKNQLLQKTSIALISIVLIQLIYGAFTAGLDAGFGNNSFSNVFDIPIKFGSIINDPFTVVFIHKYLGVFILITALLLRLYIKKISMVKSHVLAVNLIAATVFIQFLLGVFTLAFNVPIDLGIAHQGGAVLVLSSSVFLLHES